MASARKPRGLPQRCSLGHAKSDIHRLDGLSCHSLAQIVERDHHCGGVLIRGHANVRKIGSCHCRNPRASFYDSNEWTIGERRSSTSVQRRCRKCVPIPELQSGKDPSDQRPTMRHKSKRTLDIACCHRHLDLSDVMMCQNFVGAEVICACRMMRGRDWAGTATAGTSHSAGSEEVNLQSSKRQERELQSSRETTRSGNSFRALDSSAIPFRKTVHKPRQQLRTWMFRSIQVLEYARIRDSKIRREIDEDHAPSHTRFRPRRFELAQSARQFSVWQRGEDHRLFATSEFLPVDVRFELSVENTTQMRMRGGKWLSIEGARCSADTPHLRMTREPVKQLPAAIARCAEDNRVNSHRIFRGAAEFYLRRGRQAVLDLFAHYMPAGRVLPRSERRRDCRSRDPRRHPRSDQKLCGNAPRRPQRRPDPSHTK